MILGGNSFNFYETAVSLGHDLFKLQLFFQALGSTVYDNVQNLVNGWRFFACRCRITASDHAPRKARGVTK